MTIVVDLDGTVYDSRWRNALALQGRWDEFHAGAMSDQPNIDIVKLIRVMSIRKHTIVGCTGRPEAYRKPTLAWLSKHKVPLDDLLMRSNTDWRSDTEVKPDLLKGWLAENNQTDQDVEFILEDRNKMVDAWRRLGFNCYQVREGAY